MSVHENDPSLKNKIFRRLFQSPIDINVINTEQIQLPELKWSNYEKIPQEMQLENSGETCIYTKLLLPLVTLIFCLEIFSNFITTME